MSTVVEPKRASKDRVTLTHGNQKEQKDFEAKSPDPRKRWKNGIDWPVVLWLGFVHIGALSAPFFFTWKAVGVFVALWWITGALGITLGYHRLLTHGSFKAPRWFRRTVAVCGALAGEGPPITWVAVHRKHHLHSDADGDPHSPRDGAWWSHMVWLFPRPRDPAWQNLLQQFGKDLLRDPFMRSLDRTFLLWHFGLGFVLLAVGWLGWDLYTGLSFVAWGTFLRMVFVLHITWLVNSASHMWGYRNYETDDNSRNLWWVGLLAFGEGWHNNHHAFPGRARHGHRWWEIDLTYATICLLEKMGVAKEVLRGKKSG